MIGFWILFLLAVACAVWGYCAASVGDKSRFHRANIMVKRVAFFVFATALFAACVNSAADDPSPYVSQLDYVAIPALTYLLGYVLGSFVGNN